MAMRGRTRSRPRSVAVLTRQRVVGADNGSSAYLLSVCGALAKAGWRVRFVGPSPLAFGRWPGLLLKPEMGVFERISIRGSVRLGDAIVSLDPRRLAVAGATVAKRAFAKAGLGSEGWVKPAPYAIAAPTVDADRRFAARALEGADAVLCDYAFLAPLAAECAPDLPRLVLMHDLFSARAALFEAVGAQDSVVGLSAEEEFALLRQAHAIAAIQEEEARAVAPHAPRTAVITAPMAVAAVDAPSPGEDARLLFVGGGAAPNVNGLAWFLDAVWPLLRAQAPGARLDVVGAVCRRIEAAPAGVAMHRPQRDLGPFYASAGVAEAAAHGVGVAETARDFARAILALIDDPSARIARAAAASDFARARFSPAAAYGPLIAWFDRAAPLTDSSRHRR